jgi:UDP-glucose 4-epimerase
MAVCLVTGGAGFIGSHLVEALLARGDEVRVLDNLSTGHAANLAGVESRIDLIVGDVLDLDTLEAATRSVEVVYHQAALASVPRSIADPWSTHEACATGTLRVLQAAREAGVRRVVYAASSSAYGNSERLPKCEIDPTSPLSPYAVAKLAGEQYCAAFSNVYGLETVRLRYFNVFGPRQSPDSPYAAVIPLFVQAMTVGRRPHIHGDGRQSRDFTYIADVIQANLLAAEAPGVSGRVYNVACNRRTTLLELVAEINRILSTKIDPVHGEPRPGDVRHSQADISRAQADLGYRPSTDVARGIANYVKWYLERTSAIKPLALSA